MTMKSWDSNSSTMRLPMRRSPVTRLPSSSDGGGATERSTNGLLRVRRTRGCCRIWAPRATRYCSISGSSGMESYLAGSALDGLESTRGSDLRLRSDLDQLSPTRGVEAGTSHEHSIDLGTGQQLSDIPLIDAAAVEDRHPNGDP